MRPGWSKYLVEILEKVSNLLEEADDSDFNWRCRYLNAFCKALVDAEKKPEALKILDKLIELTKKKGNCNFQEVLFRTRIHLYRDVPAMLANIEKDAATGEDTFGFKPLFVIQKIQSEITQAAMVEKELQLLMSTVAPAAISDDPVAAAASAKLSPILQDRIAECGRMAIKHNLVLYAEGACNVVARARQGSLRAKVWCEYTKAELMLKKQVSDIDPKTGMKFNTLQRQIEDFERRVEALKILDRAMIANKRLQDPDVTIEGCILIWNTGIPLLKKSARHQVYKPFQAAATALELIEANETYLRVCLHLELAKYEIEQDFLSKAAVQLKKALLIDCSQVQKALGFELNENDNPEDFLRPYDKALKFLLKKLTLKTNIYGGDPESPHEQVILDVENAKATKNTKMRIMLLEKAVVTLSDIDIPEFEVKPELKLVEEEIIAAKRKFTLQQIRERKERVLINSEISQLAMQEMQIQLAFNSATLSVAETWDYQKDADLIIAQSNAHIQLAKCYVEFLLEEDIEIGHKELVTLEEDQDEREFTDLQKATFAEQKEKFTYHIIKAVNFGQQVKQSWLVFNAAIEFWNNYLPIFKKNDFFQYVLPQGIKAMAECFEAMSNCFTTGNFAGLDPNKVDYELDKKMVVYSNLSMLLARIYEFLNQNADAVRICDILLQKQLPSSLRKTFDSIRARVTKQVSNLGASQPKAAAAAPKGGKGAAPVEVKEVQGPSKVEILTSEVLSYLELIQNGQKEMIQKALDALNLWVPNEQEEIEVELNVELWCRLGRLSINQNTNAQFKVALYCADSALKNGDQKAKQKKYDQIPITRLRWYSVAEALYGEALYRLLDTQKQEKESQDKLLHASVGRFVESCNIAAKANINYLVLESSKSLWNAMVGVLDSPNNRKLLLVPMTKVHSYLLACQEASDPDFLSLFYTAFFQCIAEQKEWKLGEKIVDEAFKYIPNTHHKVLWEAKMNFLSKLGKNVLSAISNMKESNASLMAKVWVRLARSSQQELEQHQAYNKAIEILRKEESIEVVEVLIEYAEWMHRNQYNSQDVEDQLMLAVDLLMDIEPGWDEDDDDLGAANQDDEAKTKKTGKSHSSKHSKALTKKSKGGKSMKHSQAGKTTKSKVSKASLRSKSMKSSGSRQSKKTTTSFSKRQEEDANPTFLNCSHYDKLVRIHSMLAMLAPDATKQKEYALDGHYFVMKLWEQSFISLNAILFFESHVNECAELGFKANDQASRHEYFSQVLTSNEFSIPIKYNLPEKPEEWCNFELPPEFTKRCENHEDKVMIGKWTFMKPELTYLHLKKLADILESQYFSVQMLPLLKLLEIFAGQVIGQPILEASHILQQSRLLMNMGLKSDANKLIAIVEQRKINLTEEDKKVQYEKIKALKDEQDNLKDENIYFLAEEASDPQVIESVRVHEAWLLYSEELIKWGDFSKAKDMAKECNLHARILKDQDSYTRSLLVLQTVAYLEGDSAGSLRIAMLCQKYCKDIPIVEQSIVQTANLLLEFEKYEDLKNMLDPALVMLTSMRRQNNTAKTNSNDGKKQKTGNDGYVVANLPLEYAISTCLGLQAISYLKQSQSSSSIITVKESEDLLESSLQFIKQLKNQMSLTGFKESHIVILLRYCKMILDDIKNNEITDLNSINFIQKKLSSAATFLLLAQEYITNQVYFIGIHSDSAAVNKLSLPLLRLLGVTKIRIAQTNTIIGVVKASLKHGQSAQITDKKKLDKIVANFMEAITKQIDAQSNTYKHNMNRYEKSISILYSALNLLHQHCPEYAEALVEVAKNRRYLAVNKKHLRGQWRQDAINVEEINLKLIQEEEGKDRKDVLEEKGLDGEIRDQYVDYKKEMLQSFVDLLNDQSGSDTNAVQSTFDRIIQEFGNGNSNVLGTFALEFAEGRANLNKEQAFFYIALYQYAISREQLLKTYLTASPENHQDIRKRRAQQIVREQFSYYTSPALPANMRRIEQDQNDKSLPFQIMRDYFSIDQLREGLPGQTGYLVIQLSEDMSSLYIAYSQITKERKFQYYVTKQQIQLEQREKLRSMTKRLSQVKINMQKTPITIQEDLVTLEQESEQEVSEILAEIEKFFEPVTSELQNIIHPVKSLDQTPDLTASVDPKAAPKGGPAAAKAPAKAAPPAKGKGAPVKGGPAEIAAYESVLPLTTGGIESIVLLVDRRIESLPIESLQIFSKVSVVARDFNLHLHMHRVNAVGHKAELHNNTGISKEELRYIIDIPDTPALKQKSDNFISKEMGTLLPGSVWDGILNHKNHIPSEGEWQKQISAASLFVYFSMTCLLHKFPSALISDLTIFSKCKAMVIFDRMNSFKSLVDRTVMTSKHFTADDQPMQQVALFTLCGVNSIVINNWSTTPEANMEQFEQLMRATLADGLYLGSAGMRKRKPESQLSIYQQNSVTYGVPLLRMQ